jgi:uncharacterized protein YjcR
MAEICGAKTGNGKKCQYRAGRGTDHVGTGKCHLHGGASKGAPKGNKNALKHGLYSRVFSNDDLEAAKSMQGNIDYELAIARLQLVEVIKKQTELQDNPLIQEIHEKTIVQDDETKKAQAFLKELQRSAKECGEEYDPDGDEEHIEAEESEIFERKRVFQRRDFSYEITRLLALIAKLESTSLTLQQKQLAIEEAKKPKDKGQGGIDDLDNLTDTELDRAILELFNG